MSRDLDASLALEVVKPRLEPIFLVEGFFASGDVRFWNGIGALTWNGNQYNGSGNLISVSEISETQDLQAQGITYNLNGMSTSNIAIALNAVEYTGRTTNLYFSALDSAGVLVGDPYRIFSGYMDVASIRDNGLSSSVALSVENKLLRLKNTLSLRYTPEDQKRTYPDDLGLDFVPFMQNKELTWGKATPSS